MAATAVRLCRRDGLAAHRIAMPKKNLNYEALWNKAKALPWCVLVTTGRTGTDFFQSLLDGHPEVVVFNGKLFFHPFWESAVSVIPGEDCVLADVLDEFVGTYIRAFKSRYDRMERKDRLGETRDQSINIDVEAFKQHVTGLMGDRPVTSANMVVAVYVAYELCLGRDIGRKKLILHHLHHVRKVDEFMAEFPASKIICMTRDPRALYVSGVENWRRHNPATDNPAYPQYVLWRAVDEMAQLRNYNDGRLRALKLEDLENGQTLVTVCDWLGLSMNDCLRESTWAGLRWWGDEVSESTVPENERGYSKTMTTNKWEQRLGALDKAVLDYLLADILEWYRYPVRRRDGLGVAVLMVFAILLPTIYERRYLSPLYLGRALLEWNPRKLIAAFYHPVRRIFWFYRLLLRRWRGAFFAAPYLSQQD